jgi:hypothetical protein
VNYQHQPQKKAHHTSGTRVKAIQPRTYYPSERLSKSDCFHWSKLDFLDPIAQLYADRNEVCLNAANPHAVQKLLDCPKVSEHPSNKAQIE